MTERVKKLGLEIGIGIIASETGRVKLAPGELADHRALLAQLLAADMVAKALLEQGAAIDRLTHLLSQSIRIRH